MVSTKPGEGWDLSYEGWTKSCRPTMLDMGTWGHECRIASWTQRAYLLAFLQPFSVCTAWPQLLGLLWRVAALTSCQLVSWPEHEHCRQMPYRCWLYLPNRSHSISRFTVSVTRGTAAGRPPRPCAVGLACPQNESPPWELDAPFGLAASLFAGLWLRCRPDCQNSERKNWGRMNSSRGGERVRREE